MQLGKVRVAQQLVNGDARSRDRKNVVLRAPAGRMLRILDLDLVRSAALADRRRNRRPADRWVKNHPRLRDDHLQTTKTGPSVQEQSRQGGNVLAMSASGQSRRFDRRPITSALLRLVDVFGAGRHVSKGPRPCENRATWGALAHFAAAEFLIRRNRPLSGNQELHAGADWLRRDWPHARIASSNPPTPTIVITRFML
jgi:hypothetical protein